MRRWGTLIWLSYKEQYATFNLISFMVYKIVQPMIQVIFFVLLISKNGDSNIKSVVLTNIILAAVVNAAVYSGVILSNERVQGTLKLIVASRNDTFKIVFLRSLAGIIDAIIMVIVPIILAKFVLHIDINSIDIIAVVITVFLGMLAAIPLSLLIGSMSLITTDLNLFINLFIFVINFFSGALFSSQKLPYLWQVISNFIPLHNSIQFAMAIFNERQPHINWQLVIFSGREISISIVLIIVNVVIYKKFERTAQKGGTLELY
ncbi:hypothetical protein WFA24289_01866 [Periweissella fabaria]|uniref:Transport permease protein n=1 Tax=Periweissella fabaria TaxID=546157 RepID=A0ABM8Z9Y6_9LACO|nr:ABC transporter permease [Periweissella fabaria]CAH0417524.1 hypothetical protein WFA24289_01866 [Periweissella fabaria]